MSERTDLLRAELEAAELEDQLVTAKADGTVTNELRGQVREARRVHRTLRAEVGHQPGVGDAEVSPDTIEARAGVERP